ncbi:MAG: inverse autotransporter beta domain-containing protein [Rhodospirillaceae bacterium]|nr:inverse autotransporter beta domain-containing protein [Rhodospirillaceae bacterium]
MAIGSVRPAPKTGARCSFAPWARTAAAAFATMIALGAAHAQPPKRDKYQPYVDLGFKPGNKRGIGQLNLMMPLLQAGDWILFADLRGMADTERGIEGNAGIGYRRMAGTRYRWIYGGYVFFDARRSKSDKLFYQINPGVELLSEDFDARANGYIPTGRTRYVTATGTGTGAGEIKIAGTRIFMLTPGGSEEELSLSGFDGELGWRLPWLDVPEIRLYAGGYAFFRHGVKPVIGPRFRAEARLFDLPMLGPQSRFTFGIETSWDRLRKQQVYGFFNLRIPLGAPPFSSSPLPELDRLERRMVDPVVKDVDVVTATRKTGGPGGEEPVLFNGVEIKEVQEVRAADDLPAKVAAAPQGTIFVIIGSVSTTAAANVLSNHFFIGGGTTLPFTGAFSGTAAMHTFAGAAGILNTSAGAFTLAGVTNALFKNFTINDTGTNTFVMTTSDKIVLEDMIVAHTPSAAGSHTFYNPDISGSISVVRSQITSGNGITFALLTLGGPTPPFSSGSLLIDASTITASNADVIRFNANNNYAFIIRNNSVLTSATNSVAEIDGQANARITLLMQDSRLSAPNGIGLYFGTTATAQISATVLNSRIDSGSAAVYGTPNGNGSVFITLTNNILNASAFSAVQFNVNSFSPSLATGCLSANANALTHGSGFDDFRFFTLDTGVMNVVDFANLSANNNGATILGTPNSVLACP